MALGLPHETFTSRPLLRFWGAVLCWDQAIGGRAPAVQAQPVGVLPSVFFPEGCTYVADKGQRSCPRRSACPEKTSANICRVFKLFAGPKPWDSDAQIARISGVWHWLLLLDSPLEPQAGRTSAVTWHNRRDVKKDLAWFKHGELT